MNQQRHSGPSQRARGLLLALTAAAALLAATAAPALAKGPSSAQLVERDWTCFVPPTVPAWVVCYNPGLGRPILNDPDPRPVYAFLAFSSVSGEFLFTGHLVRADLYADQPCAPGAEPYVFRGLIGYYECVHA